MIRQNRFNDYTVYCIHIYLHIYFHISSIYQIIFTNVLYLCLPVFNQNFRNVITQPKKNRSLQITWIDPNGLLARPEIWTSEILVRPVLFQGVGVGTGRLLNLYVVSGGMSGGGVG